MIDVNALVGPYPFRYVPHPDPDALVRVLDREGLSAAWVGHIPSAFYRDPLQGNAQLYSALVSHPKLRPVPTIRPDWPGWQGAIAAAKEAGAPAVRVYPPQWQLSPDDTRLHDLATACGKAKLAVILTVRFEDLRQRHPHDVAGDLQPAAVRSMARAGEGVRLIVTAAGREFIEEVHWSLTPAEQKRVVWDFSWVWGPPEDHFAKLLRTIGGNRFVFGSHWPLRLTQNPKANLELLPKDLRRVRLADPDKLFDG
jgi:predicted TIM-barrel fold metal-dependent hydrolase